MSDYSIWMLEYAHCLAQPTGSIFYGQSTAGSRKFPYSYVYVEGEGHRILIDVGHDDEGTNRALSSRYDVKDWQAPEMVLAKIGVRPEEVDTVVLTHAHYDHAGASRHFPNAIFYLQRGELEGSLWALENEKLFRSIIGAIDPADIALLAEMAACGRLVLLDGDRSDLLPGVTVRAARDTHTAGSQFVVVSTGGQEWVVTGDNMYSYENAEGLGQDGTYVSIGSGGGSSWNNLTTIDEMLRIAGSTDRLVIVHEAETFVRNPSRTFSDGLSVAELVLVDGVSSRI